MDRCDSKMNADSFIRLTTYAVGLKLAVSKPRLKDLFDLTLFRIQNRENGANVEELVEQSVNQLIKTEGLEKVNDKDEYTLTKIATAAITGL